MNPTLYLSVKHPLAKRLSQYPNAGPNPNITGMRNMYYGKSARLIKSGQFVYKVPSLLYEKIAFAINHQ